MIYDHNMLLNINKRAAKVFLFVGIITTNFWFSTGIVSAHSRAVSQQVKPLLDPERWPALPDYPYPDPTDPDLTYPDPTDPDPTYTTPDTPIPHRPDPVVPMMQPTIKDFGSATKQ
jgi:hypothetical protein